MITNFFIGLGIFAFLFSPLIFRLINSSRARNKALSIGKVKCNQCGTIGNLKPSYHLDKFACKNCGSFSWKKVDYDFTS